MPNLKSKLRKAIISFLKYLATYTIPLTFAFLLEFWISKTIGEELDGVYYDSLLSNTLLLGLIGVFFINIALYAWSLLKKKQELPPKQKQKFLIINFTFLLLCFLLFLLSVVSFFIFKLYIAQKIQEVFYEPRSLICSLWVISVIFNGVCQQLR